MDRLEEVLMEGNIRFISMGDLHSSPKDIRVWLKGGEHMLLSHSGNPLAYMRPVTEEDLDTPRKMMSFEYLRNNRDEFLYFMKTGEDVVLCFHHRQVALITPEIPGEFLESFNEKKQAILEERRKKREESPKDTGE
jgi:antitoxin (DNA-binding transcriptional repressor) of toxin-antitoxin stability system